MSLPADVTRELAAIAAWELEAWPRLDDRQRAEVHALLGVLTARREQRTARHRDGIERRARGVGHQVSTGALTLTDAQHRLDALCSERDPEVTTPVYLVPYRDARALAVRAFAEGVRQGRTR
jgi:hypothetical protein